jgi:hypothetical protein
MKIADEKLVQLMIRLATRLDKVEAELIDLKGFVGYIKQQQEQEKAKEKQEKENQNDVDIIETIKFETLKQRINDTQ